MPARSKGLTWSFLLRTLAEEKAAVVAVVAEYAQFDIKISMNDAVRILIRRGRAEETPLTLDLAKARILAHWEWCTWCSSEKIGCPDGARLKGLYDALAARPAPPKLAGSGDFPRPGKSPNPASSRPRLLPPPPGVQR